MTEQGKKVYFETHTCFFCLKTVIVCNVVLCIENTMQLALLHSLWLYRVKNETKYTLYILQFFLCYFFSKQNNMKIVWTFFSILNCKYFAVCAILLEPADFVMKNRLKQRSPQKQPSHTKIQTKRILWDCKLKKWRKTHKILWSRISGLWSIYCSNNNNGGTRSFA